MMQHREEVRLNILYILIHFFYWLIYALIVSFASVYLLDRGLSNTVIGFILAGGNILSVVLQPILATYIDCNPNLSLKKILGVLFFLSAGLSLLLQFVSSSILLVAILMILLLTIYLSTHAPINALAFRLLRDGITINFGMARGLGSLFYSGLCTLLGLLIRAHSSYYLPLCYAVSFTLLAVLVLIFREPQAKVAAPQQTRNESSLLAFLKRYKAFDVFTLGCVLVFFSHYAVTYFMIQVVSAIGGDSASMGNAVAISALAEAPVIFFFSLLNRKLSSRRLLQICAIVFVIKQTITLLAASVPVLYLAQFFQCGAYGLYIPASVAYATYLMREGDSMRGQTMFTIAPTIGSLFASFLGGILLDRIGVRNTLIVCVIVSALGACIMLLSSCASSMRQRPQEAQADPSALQ